MLKRRRIILVTALLCIILFFISKLFFYNFDYEFHQKRLFLDVYPQEYINESFKFLVNSSKCKIPNVLPFNSDAIPFFKPKKYYSCSKRELLTYVTKKDNYAILNIDKGLIPYYTKNGINCCYSNITRDVNEKNPDDGIKISKCVDFSDSVLMNSETILVKCLNSRKKQIYENIHTVVLQKPSIMDVSPFNKSSFSVLIVGIDSISRLNLIRTMPKTSQYLQDHEWIPLLGYNKIDDNTFPNLMAILTGFNHSYAVKKCDPGKIGKLDECPFIWKTYKKEGYITAYAEDDAKISTFNYVKKGFSEPPTDYYFRPYILAAENLTINEKRTKTYCAGPETSGERILNVAKDFVFTFKESLSFGFFWMNTFSHNKINTPSSMDLKVRKFLEDIEPIMENTIVIFLSDHGIRFGKFRYTFTGWYEERLPFIYISLPKRLQKVFPNEVNNFRENSNKLTNPYDLHMTLQHILVLSKLKKELVPCNACPGCKSLFENIEERSCKEAAIEQHWCTCIGYTPISQNSSIVTNASNFILQKIHKTIQNYEKCAKYSLNRIISSQISDEIKEKFILVVFETTPKAVFEGTVSVLDQKTFKLEGSISRLDTYANTSECMFNGLKKYCHCRE